MMMIVVAMMRFAWLLLRLSLVVMVVFVVHIRIRICIHTAGIFHGGASQSAHYANEILCLINGKSDGWQSVRLTCVRHVSLSWSLCQRDSDSRNLPQLKSINCMSIIHHIKVICTYIWICDWQALWMALHVILIASSSSFNFSPQSRCMQQPPTTTTATTTTTGYSASQITISIAATHFYDNNIYK